MFMEPNSAPSWKRTPKPSRMAKSSSSFILMMLLPNTRMSPASGYSKAMMCLRSTLLPVPDGPSTVVMAPSTKSTVRPLRTLNPLKALWTSSTSIAAFMSVGDGGVRRQAPEELRAEHADHVDEDHVEHHRLGGVPPDADRAARCLVAVVATHEDDGGAHGHDLEQRVEEVGGVLEQPEGEVVAAV